jgi:hypothetical protein
MGKLGQEKHDVRRSRVLPEYAVIVSPEFAVGGEAHCWVSSTLHAIYKNLSLKFTEFHYAPPQIA